jgi:hypothetical protein
MSENTDEQDSFRRGAEAMRAACLAIIQPLGEYSNTPEMQARLTLRLELEGLICQIEMDWLEGRSTQSIGGSPQIPPAE